MLHPHRLGGGANGSVTWAATQRTSVFYDAHVFRLADGASPGAVIVSLRSRLPRVFRDQTGSSRLFA
jgi:hypothetical protein